jgi:hypothetical protein
MSDNRFVHGASQAAATHVARLRRRATLVVAFGIFPQTSQLPSAVKVDPCELIPRVALRHLTLPRGVKGVPDSTGVSCQWGSIEASQALVLKTYATMAPATLERMRIAASKTSDPILEPSIAPGAWSVDKSFGRVLVAGKNGKAFQLQYYVRPHSRGADRVDVRSTEADREALLAVAKVALSRL